MGKGRERERESKTRKGRKGTRKVGREFRVGGSGSPSTTPFNHSFSNQVFLSILQHNLRSVISKLWQDILRLTRGPGSSTSFRIMGVCRHQTMKSKHHLIIKLSIAHAQADSKCQACCNGGCHGIEGTISSQIISQALMVVHKQSIPST
jgi:hypothetical protein